MRGWCDNYYNCFMYPFSLITFFFQRKKKLYININSSLYICISSSTECIWGYHQLQAIPKQNPFQRQKKGHVQTMARHILSVMNAQHILAGSILFDYCTPLSLDNNLKQIISENFVNLLTSRKPLSREIIIIVSCIHSLWLLYSTVFR